MAEPAGDDPPAGPYDHLTDEQKQQLVRGKCNFLTLMLLSTIAFVQSGTAAGYCNFADRDIRLVEGTTTSQACAFLNMTGWDEQVCSTLFSKHGVGYYAWYGTIPVDQQVCLSYDQYVPGVGIVTPSFDTAFEAGRVFAIMANVFGAFAWFTILFASCCPLHNERMRGLSCWFVLAYICQAFSFLLFGSNVCDVGFFLQYLAPLGLTETNIIQSVTCSLGTGGGMSVSATVIYFVCSLLAPVSLAPLPIGYERMAGFQQQQPPPPPPPAQSA